jgi:hypothetical protein
MANHNSDSERITIERWRGAVDMKLEHHEAKIEDHCERLATVEEKVSQVLVKLAVPLFLVGISGPVVGALIVWAITKR